MYKKKLKKRNIILVGLILLAVILGFTANVMTTNRNLTIFEKAIKDSVLFINKTISSPFRFISNKIESGKEKKDLLNKYNILKEKEESYNSLEANNEALKHEIDELKKTLELNNILTEYETINATVINRNLGYWYNTITIDKGEYNGVVENMPVIVSEGLIGKVVSVSIFSSTIRLITANDINDKISVQIDNDGEFIYGILSGYNDTFKIDGIVESHTIVKGSKVTTTGMGIYPAGIMIGEVVDEKKDNFDLAPILEVKSYVDFNNLKYVTLIKKGAE